MATEPRLATHVWVGAWMMRARAHGLPVYVAAHGHDEAGAVIVKCATLDGRARAWSRGWDLATGARRWAVHCEGDEREVDQTLARERARDPDLWILEIEDRQGRSLLDEPGLAD